MNTISEMNMLRERAERLVSKTRSSLFKSGDERTLDVIYKVTEATEMVGRSQSSIVRAEREGDIPAAITRSNGRRAGYSLEQINKIRDYFGTRPSRSTDDEPVILSMQNFKGGVGKSTLAVHASHYFAQKGYRVLLVDADPQASSTLTFGYNPDQDISPEETLYGLMVSPDEYEIREMVRASHWDGLDLIPANLDLFNVEYELAAHLSQDPSALVRLKKSLRDVAQYYDIVIIDPPPALGMISLSVLQAANAMIIPAPPSIVDFCSTASFLKMAGSVLKTLEGMGQDASYKFVRFLVTKADLTKAAQSDLRDAMGKVFSDNILSTALLSSVAYDEAALNMRSLYEATGSKTQSYNRARSNMDQVFAEVELEIRKTWPSHAQQLRDLGRA